jgi:hypothetical protein
MPDYYGSDFINHGNLARFSDILRFFYTISLIITRIIKHSLRVGWRNLVRVSLIFAIIVSFLLFTVFPLV